MGLTWGTQVLVRMPCRCGGTPRNMEVWQGKVDEGMTVRAV